MKRNRTAVFPNYPSHHRGKRITLLCNPVHHWIKRLPDDPERSLFVSETSHMQPHNFDFMVQFYLSHHTRNKRGGVLFNAQFQLSSLCVNARSWRCPRRRAGVFKQISKPLPRRSSTRPSPFTTTDPRMSTHPVSSSSILNRQSRYFTDAVRGIQTRL